jgi:hypothetical protein
VLNALVDDYGNQLTIGAQEDVGEFNIILISRIEQGLRTKLPKQEERPANRSSSESPLKFDRSAGSSTEGSKMLQQAIM